MKILFIHKNYPAQFGRLASWLADHGWDVSFATAREDLPPAPVKIVRFRDHRDASRDIHHYLTGTERAVITGQGVARMALALKEKGYEPDVVVAHSGWGVGFFVKDVWPTAKYVQYAEWYYNYPYPDQTPYLEPKSPVEDAAKTRTRNAPFWLDFSAADATICPTHYQASRFPEKVQENITVLNDGFDTKLHRPAPRDAAFLEEHGIPADAELLTYIARGMEPARGFPELMKALEKLMQRRPTLHALIIGQDRVAYGPKSDGPSWKTRMLESLDLDESRLHFPGLVSRATMIKALQASDAHLYLSAPFVLSWSFVEAMACEAPIVAARSAPVEEFMTHRERGLLADPYDTASVVAAVEELLDQPAQAKAYGSAARAHIVANFDAEDIIFPRQARFFSDLTKATADLGDGQWLTPDTPSASTA